MTAVVHRLKTWPEYWDAAERGDKTFEVRCNDRDFREGDRVILVRFDPAVTFQPVRELEFEVGYVLPGGQFGIEPGFAAFALRPVRAGMSVAAPTVVP